MSVRKTEIAMDSKYVWIGLSLLILAGCYTRVRPDVDGLVCTSAGRPVDLPTEAMITKSLIPTPEPKKDVDTKKPKGLLERVQVSPDLPGGQFPEIKLPNPKSVPKAEFDAAVKKYFPPLRPIGPDPQPVPGPDGKPLTLADLQKLARENSPLLRQVAFDVAAAEGAAKQAGAYPNPTFGVESATHGPSGGPSYGVLLSQTIKTMGKTKLAQAAAIMDLENVQLAYHRAETDLMSSVRSFYFAVLVAQEAMKANRALVNLTDEIYKVNVDQVGGGEAAPYEAMQVAVFAGQARQALITARNNYTVAWRQLASSLGLRNLPPTMLEGRIDIPLPKYDFDKVLAHVLTNHTEVKTATITQQKARYNLRLAEVTAVPDVSVQTTLTQDNTFGANNRLTAGIQTTIPVPVWDKNRGAIQQARGVLGRAVEEQHRVRDDLSQRVADAFRRYDENRDLLEIFRVEILPKQVQAFRAAVRRYYEGEIGKVAYTDLIASEQNLVGVIGPYLAALGAQWQAVVDVANLLQTEDLFQAHGEFPVAAVPNLEQLLQLPCCHPCSPYPGSVVLPIAPSWQKAGFLPVPNIETLPPAPKEAPAAPKETTRQTAPTPLPASLNEIEQARVAPPAPRLGTPLMTPPVSGKE
jgi:cobalt-zinc-cadmium efflux system outer membrane protein